MVEKRQAIYQAARPVLDSDDPMITGHARSASAGDCLGPDSYTRLGRLYVETFRWHVRQGR